MHAPVRQGTRFVMLDPGHGIDVFRGAAKTWMAGLRRPWRCSACCDGDAWRSAATTRGMEAKGRGVDTAREIILVKSGGEAAMPQWRRAFAALVPDLDVRWWGDPSVDPDAVCYVLVWQPEQGRIAGYRNLRVIFSSGAGVDHITCDPDLPQHLPIVRMASDETIQTVCEYVCLGVLAIQRDLRRMIAGQAACLWEEFEPPRTAFDTRVGIMGL